MVRATSKMVAALQLNEDHRKRTGVVRNRIKRFRGRMDRHNVDTIPAGF
jgi:hypothetical protein